MEEALAAWLEEAAARRTGWRRRRRGAPTGGLEERRRRDEWRWRRGDAALERLHGFIRTQL
jgi:hypothetical protein